MDNSTEPIKIQKLTDNNYVSILELDDSSIIGINDSTYDDAPDLAIRSICMGRHDIFLNLIDQGMNLTKKNIDYLLFLAAQVGELDTVKYLVEILGADINYHNGDVLFYAYTEGHDDIMDYLISKGGKSKRLNKCK